MRPPVFAGPMLRQRRSCSSAGSSARGASLTAPATRIVPERITKRSRIGAVYVGFYHLVGCMRAPEARARTASLRAPAARRERGSPRAGEDDVSTRRCTGLHGGDTRSEEHTSELQ